MFRFLTPDEIESRSMDLPAPLLERCAETIAAVRSGGDESLRRYAEEWDGLTSGGSLFVGPDELAASFEAVPVETRALLGRTAARIREFAERQRECVKGLVTHRDGLEFGHECIPVRRAGCYAPGGRYPLASSVLMTTLAARAAGVEGIVVASPRPHPVTLAAAHLGGAEVLIAAGGAQAIAALAHGCGPVEQCDMVVGPGNRYVTAAKYLVSRDVGIDMLAGPSELLVLADADAAPSLVSADLLAQAEHDADAFPVLVTTSRSVGEAVQRELDRQLAVLSSAPTAAEALANGGIVLCGDEDEAVAVCNRLAPEHLALHVADPAPLHGRLDHFGAVFAGASSAEVLGDYGAGPNHVLPTGGQARHTGGLSVFQFLRFRTFMREVDSKGHEQLLADAEAFALLEGLPGHARSAGIRAALQARGPVDSPTS